MPATLIEVETVKAGIASARKELSQQEDYLKKISDEIDFMEDAWDSEAQRAYTDQFRSTKLEMDKFTQSVKDHLQEMERYVDDCVSVDSTVARKLNNVTW